MSEEYKGMKVLVIYDDGDREIVEGDTWNDIVNQIGCTALSLTVIEDCDFPTPTYTLAVCTCRATPIGMIYDPECPFHKDDA